MDAVLLHSSYLRWLERLLARRGIAAPVRPCAAPRSPDELERIALAALRSSRDPWLGLALGEAIPILGHGPLSALLAAAPTLRHALEDLARYAPLRAPVLRFALQTRPGGAALEVTTPGGMPQAERLLAQALAMLLERLCEQLLGEWPRGLAHVFPWTEAEDAAYRRRLRGALRFGATRYALEVPEAALATALPGADPEAARAARRLCAALLDRTGRRDRPASVAVERLLWQAEWRWPALPEVAVALATSVRSLQRALAGEGTSFRALCERVRAERARQLLAEGRMPVAAIAERLGYRDPGNFARALRRLTGATARALRGAAGRSPPRAAPECGKKDPAPGAGSRRGSR